MRTSGREVLFSPISGTFKEVSIRDAVDQLVGKEFPVSIIGDSGRTVSLEYRDRPLQLVLADLEQQAGVTLDIPWLPRLKAHQRFSFSAKGRAGRIALLIYAIRGRPVQIPTDKADRRTRLHFTDTTIDHVAQELLRSIQ